MRELESIFGNSNDILYVSYALAVCCSCIATRKILFQASTFLLGNPFFIIYSVSFIQLDSYLASAFVTVLLELNHFATSLSIPCTQAQFF